MLSIRPGVELATVIDYLAHAVNDLTVIRNNAVAAHLHHYLGWVATQQRSLGTVISTRDMDRLVTTRTYWALLGAPYESVSSPVTTEIDVRVMALNEELTALRTEMHQQELRGWTTIAVLDTNVLMELHGQLESMIWHHVVGERDMRNVHVVIPLVVIDELDRLKRSQGDMRIGGRNVPRRTIARQALRTIARMFPRHDDVVRLDQRDENGHARPVQFELLMDRPGHTRLASPDAEIRDRTLSLSAYANRVVLVTYDLGNMLAAQLDGLEVLRPDDGEELAAAT
jgi:hypothetical protein